MVPTQDFTGWMLSIFMRNEEEALHSDGLFALYDRHTDCDE